MTLSLQSFVISFITLSIVSCFNISPTPNLIFKKPNEKIYITPTRPSYFGLSLTLRNKSILIGSPRSQNTLESQKNVNEPGAVYKCNLNNERSCKVYTVKNRGSVNKEQLLGWSMDGLESEKNSFMTCATKYQKPNSLDVSGFCYEFDETNLLPQQSQPNLIEFTTPNEVCGFSVHAVEDGKNFILGCPVSLFMLKQLWHMVLITKNFTVFLLFRKTNQIWLRK